MQYNNHQLTNGNVVIPVAGEISDGNLTFQAWYEGLVATDVKIVACISTTEDGPYAILKDTEEFLDPAESSVVIILVGIPKGAYIQFRVVSAPGTAGTLTNTHSL